MNAFNGVTVRAQLLLILVLFLSLLPNSLQAGRFVVSPSGTQAGTGTVTKPWNLQMALNQPSAVRAGDTLMLRGGLYTGTFVSRLNGTSSNPIVVRAYPNEWPTIDGGSINNDILVVEGTYTWFCGFEIVSSDPRKISTQNSDWPTDVLQNTGVAIAQNPGCGTGCKFINLVVHDARQGFSLWKDAQDLEVYGCLIYYNGWRPPNKPGAGHGIYTQNQSGTKYITENIVWANFSHGIHAYGTSDAPLNNYQIVGNVVSMHSNERNILLGGGSPVVNPIVRENFVYDTYSAVSLDLGYTPGWGAGADNAVVTDNYLVGRLKVYDAQNSTVAGNVINGYAEIVHSGPFPDNTYVVGDVGSGTPPTSHPADRISVRPNKYEPGRANIVAYNWGRAASISIDPSAFLNVGDTYVVKDAQNYLGPPVTSGKYTGSRITIPMTRTSVAPKIGNDPRTITHTSSEFGVFIIQSPKSGAGIPNDVADKGKTGVPGQFDLKQNYPNPFNPSTTIEFVLPTAAHTTLEIYDLTGSKLETLVSGTLGAGLHSAVWNAAGKPSGVYFYRLHSGTLTATRRLVLVK